MTLLYMDSFDHYATAQLRHKWAKIFDYATSPPVISAGTGRRGSDSLYRTGTQRSDNQLPVTDPKTTFIVGFAIKFVDWPYYGEMGRHLNLPSFRSGVDQVEMEISTHTNAQVLMARLGPYATSPLALGTTLLRLNKWYYIETKYYAHASNGTIEVRINGKTEISYGPADTVRISDQINRIDFANTTNSQTWYMDDLYVCDALGGVNDDFLGDVRVDALFPDGVGNSADWTPSAGANWECVNENPPTDDTDYVSEATPADHDSYTFENTPITSGTIVGLQHALWARKDSAGFRTAKGIIRSGGADYEEAKDHPIGDSYKYLLDVIESDPDTSAAWLIAALNAAEFGVKLES